MANNITEVRLLSVPLEQDFKHTIYFSSLDAQYSYFSTHAILSYDELSYQRKDGLFRCPGNYDMVMKCNYCMYKNSAYNNKWFYAFLSDVQYVNDGTTTFKLDTDPIQTWMFDITIRPSFVEREHVNDDTMGLHTQEEGLQLGDYVTNLQASAKYAGTSSGTYAADNLMVVVGTSTYPNGKTVGGTLQHGIYSGLAFYAFENNDLGKGELNAWIDELEGEGAVDGIQCMFLAPKRMISRQTSTDKNLNYRVQPTAQPDRLYINCSDQSNNKTIAMSLAVIDGYTPRNKKLLTYPYRYLMVSNNNGMAVPFHFEQFKKDGAIVNFPQFVIEGCLTPGCSVRMTPLNYKGIAKNYEEGINLGKFPALNWTSDYFTNWLTQNSVSIGVGVASSVISTGVAVAGALAAPATAGTSLAATAIAVGGASAVGSTMGEIYRAAQTPGQSRGNVNCGDVIAATGCNDFFFYTMSIKKEYAEIIDGYFDMFGYKVNALKVPNKAHRKEHWYTKTIDINVDGSIPQKDLQIIKNCYNNGITFWKNPNNIGRYDLPNDIE